MVGTWAIIPCPVGILGIVQLAITFWRFFPHSQSFSSRICTSVFCQRFEEIFVQISGFLSFYAAPSTPVFCPTNPSCFGLFQHSSLISLTPWDHWTLVPLPVLWLGDAPLVSWAITGLTMFVFRLSEISLTLPVVQCLKQLYQMFFSGFLGFFLMSEGNCHSNLSFMSRSRNLISNW